MATCCQTTKKVCSPAFLLIEDSFYNEDGDCALSKSTEALFNQKEMQKEGQFNHIFADTQGTITIPTKQQQMRHFKPRYKHLNMGEQRLGDTSFRLGYPYLMRHSIVDEDDIDQWTGAASS